MRRTLLSLAAAVLSLAASAQVKYNINGDTRNQIEGAKVYLTFLDQGSIPVDSTVVKNGKFNFKGETESGIHNSCGRSAEGDNRERNH